MPEKYTVEVLVPNGGPAHGELLAYEESPSDADAVRIELHLPEADFEATADDYFSALVEIRNQLEKSGRLLNVYGASLNVYPSPMSRSMGSGEKAYKLEAGRQAKTSDLVSIFDSGPDVHPSTVKEQLEFYEEWLRSLRK